MENNDKWKKYRLKYCKEFRQQNPYYNSDYYHNNKDKFDEYNKKKAEQNQRKKAGLEPLPRTKRSKRELRKIKNDRLLKSLKEKAEQFKEFLQNQNTN